MDSQDSEATLRVGESGTLRRNSQILTREYISRNTFVGRNYSSSGVTMDMDQEMRVLFCVVC
jgi:hypothetical protein